MCIRDRHTTEHKQRILNSRLYIFRPSAIALLCTEYTNSTVKYTQRTLNFYSKVNVSWSINDIDTVFQSTGFWFAVLLQCPVACCSG